MLIQVFHWRIPAWLTLFAAFALMVAATAHAQITERSSVHLRNDCRLAAQILEKGHSQPHEAWAVEVIGRCDESGGPALQNLWLSPPADSTALEQLFAASYGLRDGRIYETVAPVARNQR